MNLDQLHKLIGSAVEVSAECSPAWDDADKIGELRLTRTAYWAAKEWCDKQLEALTELIEQHEQLAAAPLGK